MSFENDPQMLQYARDFRKVYEEEKSRRHELEQAYFQMEQFAEDLKDTVSELNRSKKDLESAYLDTIQRLALAAEFKDDDTGDHIIRIGLYSSIIGMRLGMPEDEIRRLQCAAPMHDVGKIGIPDAILLKPARLSHEEFEVMKTHTSIGGKLLGGSDSSLLKEASSIAMTHHERWDGGGYPSGIQGDEIPLAGRIVCVVDVFDALMSRRPYKEPYPLDVTLKLMRHERGSKFDPDVIDAFTDGLDDVLKAMTRVNTTPDMSLRRLLEWSLD